MNTDAKILKKILENKIQRSIKRIMSNWDLFQILKAGSIFKSQCIYHINRKKTLSHQMLQEKNFDKI